MEEGSEHIDVKALVASVLPHMKQRSRIDDIDTDIDGASMQSTMIYNLRAIHHRILHLTVAGNTRQEIADAVGYSPRMINIIQESPAFKRELERIMAKAEGRTVSLAERVQSLKHEALDVLEDQVLRDGKDLSPQEQRLRVDVAKDIIDRSGDVPNIQRKEQLVAHLTADDIAELKLRAGKKVLPGDANWANPLEDPAVPALPVEKIKDAEEE